MRVKTVAGECNMCHSIEEVNNMPQVYSSELGLKLNRSVVSILYIGLCATNKSTSIST